MWRNSWPRAPDARCTRSRCCSWRIRRYAIAAETLEEVLAQANGGVFPARIGLLTPRQIIPAVLVDYLRGLLGADNVVDAQVGYQKIKYAKSDREMELIHDAARRSPMR